MAIRSGRALRIAAAGLLAAALVSGLTSLATQVVWMRVLVLIVGSTTYAFSTVLLVYLVALAAGGAWAARRGTPTAFVLAGGYLGPKLDQAGLVELHRLTLDAAVRARAAFKDWGSRLTGKTASAEATVTTAARAPGIERAPRGIGLSGALGARTMGEAVERRKVR